MERRVNTRPTRQAGRQPYKARVCTYILTTAIAILHSKQPPIKSPNSPSQPGKETRLLHLHPVASVLWSSPFATIAQPFHASPPVLPSPPHQRHTHTRDTSRPPASLTHSQGRDDGQTPFFPPAPRSGGECSDGWVCACAESYRRLCARHTSSGRKNTKVDAHDNTTIRALYP